jgi:hypothetical protein
MDEIKKYGMMARFYIRAYWDKIEELMGKSDELIESIKERDREVYELINRNREWFNEFLAELYKDLKEYANK